MVITIVGVGILTTRGGSDDDEDDKMNPGMEMVAMAGRGTPTSNPLLPHVAPPAMSLGDSAVEQAHVRAAEDVESWGSPRGRRRSRTHSITCTASLPPSHPTPHTQAPTPAHVITTMCCSVADQRSARVSPGLLCVLSECGM